MKKRMKSMRHLAKILFLVEVEEAPQLCTLLAENGAMRIDAMIKERLFFENHNSGFFLEIYFN